MSSGFTRQPGPQFAGQQASPTSQGAAEVGAVGEVEVVGHLVAGVATTLVQLHGHARAGLIQLFLKAGVVLVQRIKGPLTLPMPHRASGAKAGGRSEPLYAMTKECAIRVRSAST